MLVCVCVVFRSDGKRTACAVTAVRSDSDFESIAAVAAIQIERVSFDRKRVFSFHRLTTEFIRACVMLSLHSNSMRHSLALSPPPHLTCAAARRDVCCNAIRPRNASIHLPFALPRCDRSLGVQNDRNATFFMLMHCMCARVSAPHFI